MPIDRRFVRLVAVGIAVHALLMLPWSPLGAVVSHAFCAIANTLADPICWHGLMGMRFHPSAWRATLVLSYIASPGEVADLATLSTLNLHVLPYTPLSVVVALSVAAPGGNAGARLRSFVLAFAFNALAASAIVALDVVRELSEVQDKVVLLARHDASVHLVELPSAGRWLLGAMEGISSSGCSGLAMVSWCLARWMTSPGRGWLWLERAAS
jgi:hypothetical protein